MALPGRLWRRKLLKKQRRRFAIKFHDVILVMNLLVAALYAAKCLSLAKTNSGDSQMMGSQQEGMEKAMVDTSWKRTNKKMMKLSTSKLRAPITTIGWVVTITDCGGDPITEGAAVLKHAIHLTSVHGNLGGRYEYKMYAIYHPDAEECALSLKGLGYELLERETPVAVENIEGKFLRDKIVSCHSTVPLL